MEAVFKIDAESLTNEFITKLKQLFSKNSYIEIRVVETDDDTQYLLSNIQNKEVLLKSLNQLLETKTIVKTLAELEL